VQKREREDFRTFEIRLIALLPLATGTVKAGELVTQGHLLEGLATAAATVGVTLIVAAGCTVLGQLLHRLDILHGPTAHEHREKPAARAVSASKPVSDTRQT
jgi:hypothetical protein